jgi:FdhD protein
MLLRKRQRAGKTLMTTSNIYTKREIIGYQGGEYATSEALVVYEKPLTLFLNHIELVTMICSPGGYEELGIGFLISEGIIQKPSDISLISCREEEGLLWVETSTPTPQTNNFLRRHMASCCGKGRSGLYFINDFRQLQAVDSDTMFSAEQLLGFINELETRSENFRLTGGVHAAALADHSGLLFMFEDIGRHNAVDKVFGKAFLEEINTGDKCLLLSGRVASEILIKAARNNVAFILSRSAPTELTIELAEELAITVVGFARGDRLNIYSHPERVIM